LEYCCWQTSACSLLRAFVDFFQKKPVVSETSVDFSARWYGSLRSATATQFYDALITDWAAAPRYGKA
jgi:hypothetical protein